MTSSGQRGGGSAGPWSRTGERFAHTIPPIPQLEEEFGWVPDEVFGYDFRAIDNADGYLRCCVDVGEVELNQDASVAKVFVSVDGDQRTQRLVSEDVAWILCSACRTAPHSAPGDCCERSDLCSEPSTNLPLVLGERGALPCKAAAHSLFWPVLLLIPSLRFLWSRCVLSVLGL